jgi:hypothetical protein
MGWSNYIVIPDWKLIVEISRYINQDDLLYIREDLESLEKLHNDLQRYSGEETNFRTATMSEISLRYVYSEKCEQLFSMMSDFMNEYILMKFLEDRNTQYRVISEFDLDDEKGENYQIKKKYKLIEI